MMQETKAKRLAEMRQEARLLAVLAYNLEPCPARHIRGRIHRLMRLSETNHCREVINMHETKNYNPAQAEILQILERHVGQIKNDITQTKLELAKYQASLDSAEEALLRVRSVIDKQNSEGGK